MHSVCCFIRILFDEMKTAKHEFYILLSIIWGISGQDTYIYDQNIVKKHVVFVLLKFLIFRELRILYYYYYYYYSLKSPLYFAAFECSPVN